MAASAIPPEIRGQDPVFGKSIGAMNFNCIHGSQPAARAGTDINDPAAHV